MKKSICIIFTIFSLILIISPFLTIKPVYAVTKFTTCTVSEDSYLRSTPGGAIIKDVDGDPVLIYEPRRLEVLETKNVNGSEYKRLKTNYYSNNYEGWIWSGYLKDYRAYTTDDNYANQLRNKGFPESYILPLVKLHAQYPNWNFEISRINIDWSTVINEEYNPVYKNLVSGPNTSLRSTDGAAYNSGTYTQFEPGWYAPSKQTIAFYMDPRNWLYDSTIFMFEQLSYNSNLHTTNTVQQILNGTFMAGTYDYNGQKWSYANTFIEAGKSRNISPVQLASRVIQEQGKDGSATINMQSDGKVYYNHFNVNAYGNSTAAIVSNALSTAKKNGWTSPYLSIMGGSSTISNGYNNVGQDTIYYQKFNTINTKSLYWNQYMANVRALPSESYTIFKSYNNSGILDSAFTFKIPVYNNMPDATTLNASENSDNTLKTLSISNCTLSPSFNSAAINYTCNVPSTINEVTVSAQKTSSYSSINAPSTVKLNNNSTKINIVVTAANGSVRTYTVTVNKVTVSKETPNDIISSMGYSNNNNIISGISIGMDRSNIISKVKNNFIAASINIVDKNGNKKENGLISTGDRITISNNGQTVTYTAVIIGDISSDGKIDISDLAMVKAYMLGKIKLTNEYLLVADINKDGEIDISDLAMIKAHMLGKVKITK